MCLMAFSLMINSYCLVLLDVEIIGWRLSKGMQTTKTDLEEKSFSIPDVIPPPFVYLSLFAQSRMKQEYKYI